MHALPRLCVGVHTQQEDIFASRSGSEDHPFADPKFHFARREVGGHDHQAADNLFGAIGLFDAGKDGPRLIATQAQRDLQELIGFGHIFRGYDPCDA